MQVTKEVRAKIFGLYLGADICMPDGHTATIVSVGLDEFNTIEHSTGSYGIHNYFGEEKLLLTHLSDISDEDLTEMFKMLGFTDDEIKDFELTTENKKAWVANIESDRASLTSEMADHLRQLGYALPAYGINDLFQAGIAIKKEATHADK